MELPYVVELLHLRTTAIAFMLSFAPLMALLAWVARPVPQASAATVLLAAAFAGSLASLAMIRRSRAILTAGAALALFFAGGVLAVV